MRSPYTVRKRETDGLLCIYLRDFNVAIAEFYPAHVTDAGKIKDILDGKTDDTLLPDMPASSKARGTLVELQAQAKELGLPEADGEYCFHRWEASGWKIAGKAIRDWRAAMRSWKSAGHMPSQKSTQNQQYGRARTHSHAPTGALNAPGRYDRTGR